MAKRSSRKAPAWLPDKGAAPGKPQAKTAPKVSAARPKATSIKGTIEGDDAQPVVVADYTEAELEPKLARILRADNRLLRAARPLIRASAEISDIKLRRAQVEKLRAVLVKEIQTFEKLCHRADIDRNHIVGASYCLCSALDEAAHHTTWGGSGKNGAGAWSKHPLTVQFHGDRDGGTKVFQLLARLAEDPDANLHLIVLIYYLMNVGFMGMYRTKANGEHEHHQLRDKLYAIMKPRLPPVPRELSPSLTVATERNLKPIGGIPVWVTFVVGAVVLLGVYAVLNYRLHTQADALLQEIHAIERAVSRPIVLRPADAPRAPAVGIAADKDTREQPQAGKAPSPQAD